MGARIRVVDSDTHHEEVKVNRNGSKERHKHIVEDKAAGYNSILGKFIQFIWLLTGLLESLIVIRLILKLIAANPAAPFARLIYGITDIFLWPFAGLTATPSWNGMVLEIPALIAMIVYALVAWAAVSILELFYARYGRRSVTVYEKEV